MQKDCDAESPKENIYFGFNNNKIKYGDYKYQVRYKLQNSDTKDST